MKANPLFSEQSLSFWGYVRALSQKVKYSQKGQDAVYAPALNELAHAANELGLDRRKLITGNMGTPLGVSLQSYFSYRADILNNTVKHNLMRVDKAKALFSKYRDSRYECPLPLNKQKDEKSGYAYFTCTINKIIAEHTQGMPVIYDAHNLPMVVSSGVPVGVMSRHVDGCFPSVINPIGVWEVKEYYYTTTFGSRIADGVYETLLDGMELDQIREHTKERIEHVLMVDAYDTWWGMGKSYLCRIIDMLHMGYVDDVLFGNEIVEELPKIMRHWMGKLNR